MEIIPFNEKVHDIARNEDIVGYNASRKWSRKREGKEKKQVYFFIIWGSCYQLNVIKIKLL